MRVAFVSLKKVGDCRTKGSGGEFRVQSSGFRGEFTFPGSGGPSLRFRVSKEHLDNSEF
jgi:hypothetical protein